MSFITCKHAVILCCSTKNEGCAFVSHMQTDKEGERRTFTWPGPSLPSPDWEKQHGRLRTNSVQPGLAGSRAVRALRSPHAGLQHAILQWVQANIPHFTLALVGLSKDAELDESAHRSVVEFSRFFFISLTGNCKSASNRPSFGKKLQV